jgi:hypothetical protein
VALNHIDHALHFVIERAGAVIVDRNPHVVLGHELVQAGKRVGIGLRVGRDRADADLPCKIENLLVRVVVVGKPIDAVSADFDSGSLQQLLGFGDLFVACGWR